MNQYRRLARLAFSAVSLFLASAPGFAEPAKAGPGNNCIKPQWPEASLRNEESGTVKLSFLIGVDGKVRETRIVDSSGYGRLDRAAATALQKCSFTLLKDNGKPTEGWHAMQYVWFLAPGGGSYPRGPFYRAPAELHSFLQAAKKADDLDDPLKRCLAYPDFPGNRWPSGLAAATCHLLLEQSIGLNQVAEHLDRAALPALDALFLRDLERHFSTSDFSEIIHRDLAQFDAGDQAARLTREWLQKAPKSPFAQAARGAHLAALAWQKRGGKALQETPKEDLKRMSELAGQAIDLYASALALEPRLLPAHAGMVEMATLDNRKPTAERAFQQARAIDPGCHAINEQHLLALGPRWGGSMGAMEAYAKSLAPHLAARPLVALAMVLPAQERADDFFEAGDFGNAAKVIERAVLDAPYPDALETLGMSRTSLKGDNWNSLVPLLLASRFADNSHRAAQTRGALLIGVGEVAWAIKALQRAHDLRPANSHDSFLLGMAFYASFSFERAEPLVAKGLEEAGSRVEAQLYLGNIAIRMGQAEKAMQYASEHLKARPKSAGGWYVLAYAHMLLGAEKEATETFKTFLRTVDKRAPDAEAEENMLVARAYLNGDRSLVPKPAGIEMVKDAK